MDKLPTIQELIERELIVRTHAMTDHIFMCGNSFPPDVVCPRIVEHFTGAELAYQAFLAERKKSNDG